MEDEEREIHHFDRQAVDAKTSFGELTTRSGMRERFLIVSHDRGQLFKSWPPVSAERR